MLYKFAAVSLFVLEALSWSFWKSLLELECLIQRKSGIDKFGMHWIIYRSRSYYLHYGYCKHPRPLLPDWQSIARQSLMNQVK